MLPVFYQAVFSIPTPYQGFRNHRHKWDDLLPSSIITSNITYRNTCSGHIWSGCNSTGGCSSSHLIYFKKVNVIIAWSIEHLHYSQRVKKWNKFSNSCYDKIFVSIVNLYFSKSDHVEIHELLQLHLEAWWTFKNKQCFIILKTFSSWTLPSNKFFTKTAHVPR